MIHVYFGDIIIESAPRQYIRDIDGYFDGYFDDNWMQNDIAKEAIKEIDKSTLIAPKVIESPVFNTISHEWLSGGTKQIIMTYSIQDIIYDGDNFGDNCWPLLLKVGFSKTVALSMSYFPIFNWVDGARVHILNNNKIVSSFKEFNRAHLDIGNKDFKFTDVPWPIQINPDRFKFEGIDF